MTAIADTLNREEVIGKNGSVKLTEACSGKYIGLYFSGVWCPPCRDFTCSLKRFYENFHDKIEIIFISWDYDVEDFNDYYEDMPWLALPYSDRETKERLCRQYDVIGTPRLVILRDDGSIVSLNARKQIIADTESVPRQLGIRHCQRQKSSQLDRSPISHSK
ncbi:hypothetical protein FSP39_016277 [Pinctada imbricata]|uniref:Thioredoxin domain-containing protein n=1 Tax=Pinctada imbricata TaxID=66713 RepID=A0AA89C1N9_PINIB|nr:hypothetical protein FSP39_016277 [Pinctada imbricata]